MALVHIPLTAFYVDDATGQIWGPDPNGTVVSPDGYRLAPQTATEGADGSATYNAPTPAVAAAAYVNPPPATLPPPASSSSSSSSSSKWLGLPRSAWYIGAAGFLAFALTAPTHRSR